MKPTLQIFESTTGTPSLKVVFPDESVRHIHSTVAPEQEYKYFQDIAFNKKNIILLGFGAGYHIIDKIGNINNDTNIILIDYFEELTENAKNNIFNNRNIKTINVNTNDSDAQLILSKSRDYQIIKHPASYSIAPDFYDKIISFLSIKSNTKKSSKIEVMLLHGTFFLEDEILNAIKKNDHCNLTIFNYNDFKSGYQFESHLFSFMQENGPDLIISVNCKGFDGEGYFCHITKQLNIPVALWFVDDPHPILLNQKKFLQDNIYAFTWEKSYISFLKRFKFKEVNYLPLACDPDIFNLSKQNSIITDIGFIGSSMGEIFLDKIKAKFLWQDKLNKLTSLASQKLIKTPESNPFEIIKNCIIELSINLPFNDDRNITWLCSYIIHTASMISRKEIITSLQDTGIEIFGDPGGWRKILSNRIKLHPNIDYRHDLCSAYQKIGININITSRQMATAVNQRVFDIPMAGSFVITDNQKDMAELFDLEKEAIIYTDIDDLKDKISYYQLNQEERIHISENARNRILEEHTYSDRLNSIINTIY